MTSCARASAPLAGPKPWRDFDMISRYDAVADIYRGLATGNSRAVCSDA